MKIEALNEGSIIVELTEEDMKNLNITYEEMDYEKIETRRVIWTILSRARQTLGHDLDTSGSMLVEAMQQGHGGCVLFFTVGAGQKKPTQHRYLMKKQAEYICFEFSSLENTYSAAQRLAENRGSFVESELYSGFGRYRLLVRTAEGSSFVKNLMLEYCSAKSESTIVAAQTRECWKCLAKVAAVEKLIPEH